jgi:hypothetical protein
MPRMAAGTQSNPHTLPMLAITSAAAIRVRPSAPSHRLHGLSGVARRAPSPLLELTLPGSSRALIPTTPIIGRRGTAPSHHNRHCAERRQPIASYRGGTYRGPSERQLRDIAEQLRDAAEGVWFPVVGMSRAAQAIDEGHATETTLRELIRTARIMPQLLREAHAAAQAVCTVDSEDTGHLTLIPPEVERRCA